jgi:Holliday junction DNA helicase RuvA
VIASLRGTVIDKGLDSVVIECAGVGYLCQATAPTLATLTRGEEVFVLTTLVVREDSQTLFAFPDVRRGRSSDCCSPSPASVHAWPWG